MNIVDPRTDTAIEDVQTLEEIKTILPYFPDDERMSRYLCYISSGWTRKEARVRAGITLEDYRFFLQDDRFKQIDSLPYDELRKTVANAYAELKVRKNTIQWLEFDEEFAIEMQRKIAAGYELTKDERAIFLKRASIYTPDTLGMATKLVEGTAGQSDTGDGMVVDMLALVLRRNGR
jgi:hypothetical protein